MTPIELKEKGYQALMASLGPINAIRFLQLAGWSTGNYNTAERHQWLSSASRESFWQDIQRIRAHKNEQQQSEV